MAKSVYSVILSDQVVAAVDRLAYQNGTSRSRLMERILAEYTGCDTPARQMADIFGQIEQMAGLHDQLKLLLTQSDELLQLKSAVPYKYNPTVKYSVSLTPDTPGQLGEVRVSVRSSSAALLETMAQFFLHWCRLEEQTFADGAFLSYRIENGKFTRSLRILPGAGAARTGDAIADYIRLLDNAMRGYFNALPAESAAKIGAANAFSQNQNADVLHL